jgi:GDPmannose 4,6-dehydratase
MKSAIITGCLGQDGSYLSEHLLILGYKVYGITRRKSTDAESWGFLEHLKENSNFKLIYGDITDSTFLSGLISDVKPEKMFNLGAQSHVGYSFSNPYATFEADACSVVHTLSALQKHSPTTRFYQASTSELFGGLNCPETGYTEDSKFHPRSPYGVAKLAAHWATTNFREAYGMFACSGILFNHESPRRGLDFVTRKVTNGVARIKAGLDTKIIMGNMDAYRDWGYAKDYVKMMNLMLDADVPQEYVIATGKVYSIEHLAETAFGLAGINNWRDYIQTDERFMRPSEVPYLLGNPEKAKRELGWVPETSFYELIELMLKEDLKRYGI